MDFFRLMWDRITAPKGSIEFFGLLFALVLLSIARKWLKGKSEQKQNRAVFSGDRFPLPAEEEEELQKLWWAPWEEMTETQKERWRELLRKKGFKEDLIAWDEKSRSRKNYKELTLAILKGIPDKDLETAIIDYLDYKLEGQGDREYKYITGLSPGLEAFYATYRMDCEISNGGFSQYFWNSTRIFAIETLKGYRLLGAPERAEIVKEAIDIAMEYVPDFKKARKLDVIEGYQQWDKAAPFDELDKRFYQCEEDTHDLRVQYVRAHPEEFVGD